MIDIEEARARIGDGVVYVPKHGPREDGVITSVGTHSVFVRYRGQHPAADGQATHPGDLEWFSREGRTAGA